jgi:hypothetical protein
MEKVFREVYFTFERIILHFTLASSILRVACSVYSVFQNEPSPVRRFLNADYFITKR